MTGPDQRDEQLRPDEPTTTDRSSIPEDPVLPDERSPEREPETGRTVGWASSDPTPVSRTPDDGSPPADGPLNAPPDGPPGVAIFSLEGRRAPGLYLVAWLLSVSGAVVTFFIGPQASDERWRFILIAIGVVMVAVGLAAGAGSQILERQDRHPERYRGPSPLLVFGVYYFAMSLLGIVLVSIGLEGVDDPASFVLIAAAQAVGFIVVVWLFAVRSGALTWTQMGWPTWQGRSLRSALRSIGIAILVMIPATFVILIGGGVVGTILGVDAPDVVPPVETSAQAFVVAMAVALVAPIAEEVFFRGFTLTAWMRDLGERKALIWSSLFFAFIHLASIRTDDPAEGLGQTILTLFVIFPVGLVFGWLFVRYGLLASIAAHSTYNAILLFLMTVASNAT